MPREFRTKRWGVNLFFIVLAILFWVLAGYLMFRTPSKQTDANFYKEELERGRFFGELAKDIGVVIFGLALVDMLWSVFGGDPTEQDLGKIVNSIYLIEQGQKCGVIQLENNPERIDMTGPVEAISRAKQSIDICGYTLISLYSNGRFKENLTAALKRNVTVRICIGSPHNADILKNCTEDVREAMPIQSRTVLDYLFGLKSELLNSQERAAADRLSVVELKDGVMMASIFRRDGLMLVVPYLRHTFTLDSPALLLVNSGERPLFDSYRKEFDLLFQRGVEYSPVVRG